MGDPFQWSISLGRWGATTVRLHVFFLIFAAATYFLCWQDPSDHAAGNLVGLATVAMVVLFLSVLAHEWGHWLVAYYHAITPDTLVIGPLGGVSEYPRCWTPRSELQCMLAGPAANLFICLVCAASLFAMGAWNGWVSLFNPLAPAWMERGISLPQQGLQLTLWINWLLLLTNLLPAFPFDGGRILHAAISIARPDWKQQRVTGIVFWLAVGLSSIIMIAAIVLLKYPNDTIFPMSFALLLMAVVLLVSARRDVARSGDSGGGDSGSVAIDNELDDPWPRDSEADEWEECDRGNEITDESEIADEGEYSQERDSEETSGEGSEREDGQWLPAAMTESCEPAPDEIEAEEERLVDEILSHLHARGMASLAPEERALLERVSARYRSRLGRRT